jgi:hypothetical protein
VAAVVAVLSVAGALLRWPAPVEVSLIVAAIVVTLWAAWAVIRRPSLVVAPLAVCLVAFGNPLALGGMATNIEAHAGLITVRTDGGFGLVFWKQYPGVAGWTAPPDPQPVDTVAFAASVQAAVRSIIDDTTSAFGLTWTVASRPSGLMPLSNGYGGRSMFDRVDSAQWHTTLDGSAAQRAALLHTTRAAAAALQLGDENAVSGDPLTGTGTTTWSDADGELTLILDADAVTVSYSGGPLLTGTSLPGEFERRMADFAGLTPPPPLVAPGVPRR